MKRYDVIQVEDDPIIMDIMKRFTDVLEISLLTTESLEGLNQILKSYRADVYLLDANFPKRVGEHSDLLVESAINEIRALDKSAENIWIFSSTNDAKHVAEKTQTRYINKNEIRLDKLMEEIVERRSH